MIETEKRKRRPAGFERLAWRRFLCVLGDGGDMYGRVKIKKRKRQQRPLAAAEVGWY